MQFLGTGSSVPDSVLTNDMLSEIVDTSDEWIRARTGIRERRKVENETAADLACEAAKKAIAEAMQNGEFSADQIDVVICATLSNAIRCPSLACSLQRDLGLKNDILAFDVNAACSGFVYALIVASQFVKEGKTVLIAGSEALTNLVDFTDRNTCVLFGDGAGALIVAPSPEDTPAPMFTWSAEAQGGEEIIKITDTIWMDGPAVFEFAVKVLLRTVREVTEKANLKLEEIDQFIFHQANERIIKSAAKRLGLPLDRFFMNLHFYGNTSAASVPLAIDEARKSGALKAGDKVVLAGFGGGLTAGAVCLTWT